MAATRGQKKAWKSDSLSELREQKICRDDLIDGEYYLQ